MPQGLIAALPLIFAGASAATQIGTSIYGALNQPETPKITAPPAAPTGPTTDQARAAITPQALTIESLTGGSVSPDYLATIAPVLAGISGGTNTPAAVQQVLASIFGKSSPTASTATPGAGSTTPFTPSGLPVNLSSLANTPGLSDFLSKLGSTVT